MINKGMMTSNTPEWATPQDLFDQLDDKFHFTLDPCATKENAKCKKFFTKEDDGLSQDWDNEIVFCNPPYGRKIGLWIKKAFKTRNATVVMLIPSRTDTRWFHEYIYKRENVAIQFLKGRLYFNDGIGRAPFPSMIVIFYNA